MKLKKSTVNEGLDFTIRKLDQAPDALIDLATVVQKMRVALKKSMMKEKDAAVRSEVEKALKKLIIIDRTIDDAITILDGIDTQQMDTEKPWRN